MRVGDYVFAEVNSRLRDTRRLTRKANVTRQQRGRQGSANNMKLPFDLSLAAKLTLPGQPCYHSRLAANIASCSNSCDHVADDDSHPEQAKRQLGTGRGGACCGATNAWEAHANTTATKPACPVYYSIPQILTYSAKAVYITAPSFPASNSTLLP